MSDEQQATGPRTFDCTVRVCKPCVELQGQECHTPDCIFFLRSMAEVKHYLDVMLLCPVIHHENGDEERIVLVPHEAPTSDEQELKPCPLEGHVPQGSAATFGPGPYVSETGDPDATKYYAVVCPGCCSTAHSRSREGVIKRWNTRADLATVAQPPTSEASRMTEEAVAEAEEIRSTAEQLVEKWYYEISTPRFENDSELAELQFRIAKALTNAQQRGAELQREKDVPDLPTAVVNLLNAFHGSGHGGVDQMVSARLHGCEKCDTLAGILDRFFSPAIRTSSQQRSNQQ